MALFVGGTQVTSTQTLDATKLTGTLPALNGSSLTNLPSSTPSNSDILSGVASASAGAVGSYAFLVYDNGSTTNEGTTSSSSLNYANAQGEVGNGTSGTWRQMGYRTPNTNEKRSTSWLRIA